MIDDKSKQVLIVSSSEKAGVFLQNALCGDYFTETANSGIDAVRKLADKDYDIVIINSPLKDGYGTNLAENIIKDSYAGVMMLVKADIYESVAFSMEKIGVCCVSKPLSAQSFMQSFSITLATCERIKGLVKKTESLKEKMEEIKLVGRAKLLLITKLSFTEDDAHRYIEKQAMDKCVKRSQIALEIIKTYKN